MENPAAKKAKPIDTTDKHMASAKNPINKTDEEISEGFIPRIAEEISYINVPAGDIPNVQVDGWRAASSQGIKVTDGMKISFHTMSLNDRQTGMALCFNPQSPIPNIFELFLRFNYF